HETGRSRPLAGLGIVTAVMLQGEAPFLGNAGQLGVADYLFAIEFYPQAITLHRDLKSVPLTARPVGLLLGCDAGADFGRHVLIHAVPVNLAGADGPHPDVYLTLGRTAQVNAGIDIIDDDCLLLAAGAFLMAAVRQNDRHRMFETSISLQTPVQAQHKIPEGLLRPQGLVRFPRLTAGIV